MGKMKRTLDELDQLVPGTVNTWKVFEKHEDQEAMIMAADYSDVWFTESAGAFNVYCMCMAGSTDWKLGACACA